MNKRYDRPSSEQMTDLHIYLVPIDLWHDRLRHSVNDIISETISAGFVRVFPEMSLSQLREEIVSQLDFDIIPRDFVYCKSIGRSLARVRRNQENQMRVKYFLPPHSYCPEIFVLDAEAASPSVSSSRGSAYSFNDKILQSRDSKINGQDISGHRGRLGNTAESDDDYYRLSELADSDSASLTQTHAEHSTNNTDHYRLQSHPRHTINNHRSVLPRLDHTLHRPRKSHQFRKERRKARDQIAQTFSPRNLSTFSEPVGRSGNSEIVNKDCESLPSQKRRQTTKEINIMRLMEKIEAKKKEVQLLSREKNRRQIRWEQERGKLLKKEKDILAQQNSLENRRRKEEEFLLKDLFKTFNSLQDEMDEKLNELKTAENLIKQNRLKDAQELNLLNSLEDQEANSHKSAPTNDKELSNDELSSSGDEEKEEVPESKPSVKLKRGGHISLSDLQRLEREVRSLKESLMLKKQTLMRLEAESKRADSTIYAHKTRREVQSKQSEAIANKNRVDTQLRSVRSDITKILSSLNNKEEEFRKVRSLSSPMPRPMPQSNSSSDKDSRHDIDRIVAEIHRREKELNELELDHQSTVSHYEKENRRRNEEFDSRTALENDRTDKQDSLLAELRGELKKLESSVNKRRAEILKDLSRMRKHREEKEKSLALLDSLEVDAEAYKQQEIDHLNDTIERRNQELKTLEREHESALKTFREREARRQLEEEERTLTKHKYEEERVKIEEEVLNKNEKLKTIESDIQELKLQYSLQLKSLRDQEKRQKLAHKAKEEELRDIYSSVEPEIRDQIDSYEQLKIEQLKRDLAQLEHDMKETREKLVSKEESSADLEEKLDKNKVMLEDNSRQSDSEIEQLRREVEKSRIQNERHVQDEKNRKEAEKKRLLEERETLRKQKQDLMNKTGSSKDGAASMKSTDKNASSSSRMSANSEENKGMKGSSDELLIDQASLANNLVKVSPGSKQSETQESAPNQLPKYTAGMSEKEQLLWELKRVQNERVNSQKKREDLVKRVKFLHSKVGDKRNQARNNWKKQYYEEKKQGSPLEAQVNKLRSELEALHQKIATVLEGNLKERKLNRPSGKVPQSYLDAMEIDKMQIDATKLLHEIEHVQYRVNETKVKLSAEIKLRTQAETELRCQKADLTQKKISLNLSRNQQIAAMGTQDLYGQATPLISVN